MQIDPGTFRFLKTLRKNNNRYCVHANHDLYLESKQNFVEFTQSLKEMNPAERVQILQGTQATFTQTGGPTSELEKKNWIKS